MSESRAATTTVIGTDTRINGEISFESTAKIMGNVEGKITARGELQVAEGATCNAVIDAARVTIDGRVKGNVTAQDRVELSSKAHVQGDLVTSKLVVAEGATFVGHCRVGPEALKLDGKGAASGVAEPKGAPATAAARK